MRKEDTYTLLGTLFSDTLAWVSGKRKSPKVLNFRTFLIFSVFIRRCVRDFNLHNQEISQSCNMLIIIKLLQINYITKYH